MRSPTLFVLSLCLAGCPSNEKSDDTNLPEPEDSDQVLDTGDPEPVDSDGDGIPDDEDCAPEDESIHPGAEEYCDGIDNDCDGEVDEEPVDGSTWYADADGDGFGDAENTVVACELPEGFLEDASDCDDGNAWTFPGATEICDGVQNDCYEASWGHDGGLATLFLEDGDWEDMSDSLGTGSESSPTAVTLDQDGTLNLCVGTWYVHLDLEADLAIQGVGTGGTLLDGGSQGPVITTGASGNALILEDLTVRNGLASDGGGLSCGGGSVEARNVRFLDNQAEQDGGGLYAIGCEIDIADSSFEGNTAGAYGGQLCLWEDSTFAIEDTSLVGGSATQGGAITTWAASGTLAGLEIDGAEADDGGGLYLAATTAEIIDSELNGCHANHEGGAASLYDDTVLVMEGVAVTDNHSDGDGGGVAVEQGSSLSIADGTLSGNVAEGDGGAIVGLGGGVSIEFSGFFGSVASIVIESSTLEGNSAESGGAYAGRGSLSLVESTVAGNSSTYAGGGLYTRGGTLSLVDSTLDGNVTEGSAGGVLVWEGGGSSEGCTFTNNEAPEENGGALVVFGDWEDLGSVFEANSADIGGAAAFWAANATLDGTSFVGNGATTHGGALQMWLGYSLEANDVSFSGNEPDDLWHSDEEQAYSWDAKVSFSCDTTSCE